MTAPAGQVAATALPVGADTQTVENSDVDAVLDALAVAERDLVAEMLGDALAQSFAGKSAAAALAGGAAAAHSGMMTTAPLAPLLPTPPPGYQGRPVDAGLAAPPMPERPTALWSAAVHDEPPLAPPVLSPPMVPPPHQPPPPPGVPPEYGHAGQPRAVPPLVHFPQASLSPAKILSGPAYDVARTLARPPAPGDSPVPPPPAVTTSAKKPRVRPRAVASATPHSAVSAATSAGAYTRCTALRPPP